MSYTKTEHKNALLKLIKEKRMILQIDAASIMNKTSIKTTVDMLEKEGKIKKEKIKVRYSNGNLNDCWLLFLPEIKHEEILNYELELINRPFESPLKQHHCYKSIEAPVKTANKRGRPRKTIETNSNVVPMINYVKINDYDLSIKEYNNQRVVSLWDVAKVHKTDNRTIKENFNNNKKYLIENEDYFTLSKVDYENFVNEKLPKSYNSIKEIILFTEQGYLLITKTLTGQLAWEVQRKLVSSYFKLKEIKQNYDNNAPVDLKNIQFVDILELIAKGFKDHQNQIHQQNSKIIELEGKFNALKEALS